MNKEIKEILELLKTDMIHIRLFKEDRDKLLDYITNLQEENERLKDTMSKIKDLNTMQYLRDDIFKEHLSFILQGSDKDE